MMHWREQHEDGDEAAFIVPDDVVDLSFRMDCAQLPVDHAWHLYRALERILPWLGAEPLAAVHSIFGAASGNGWVRPAAGTVAETETTRAAETETAEAEGLLQLSRRTRLCLRLPRHRLEDAAGLSGHTLDIGGHPLAVGAAAPAIRPLAAWHTLFARSVANPNPNPRSANGDDETAFSQAVAEGLAALEIDAPKLLCGLAHSIAGDGATVRARSVLLADLPLAESIRLQQNGLGTNLKIGCGIFLPHKHIASVPQARFI